MPDYTPIITTKFAAFASGKRFAIHRRITTCNGVETGETVLIRDAATVSDAEVRAKVQPRIVHGCRTVAEALEWCEDKDPARCWAEGVEAA